MRNVLRDAVRGQARRGRLLASVMVAGLGAACSSDVARFGNDPFANPFRSRAAYDPVTTGSTNRQGVPPAAQPAGSQPLPAPTTSTVATTALPPPGAARAPAATGSVASANYPALTPVPKAPATALGAPSGWTAAGGTPVTLQPGETITTLSNRYGVPASAILAVNGLSNATQARPGQQVVIPAYNPVTGARPPAQVAQAAAAIDRPKPEPVKAVPRPVAQPLPRAETPKLETAKAETSKAAPTRQVLQKAESEAEKRAAAKLRAEKAAPVKVEPPKPRTKPAPDDVETTASIPSPKLPPKTAPMVARNEPPKAEEKPAETGGGADNPEFRWPAKGRVISGFGARGTGGANDGINIALPEGTPVRAAEGGTVVHADDALKGYGKLVLIRHPNGYVSVYAHNSELKVKRGESVRRGQVIANSGQSGNVTAPQLHFEIRKGATPVDPGKYLGE